MSRKAIVALLLLAALVGLGVVLFRPQPVADAPALPPSAPAPVADAEEGDAAAATIPADGPALQAMLDRLRSDVDLVLREDGYPAAHRIVDEAIAGSGFSGVDRQKLMVVKLGLLGRQGDHAAMLDWMDRIIAVDPASELAAGMAKQRPAIEVASKRPANDPGPCATCGEQHPGGVHPLEPGE
jgi:hypothetical protein